MIAGTLIDIAGGQKPIEQILDGEMIRTRGGYFPALFCEPSREAEDVWTLTVTSGVTLTAPPDTDVFIKIKKFTPLRMLQRYEMCGAGISSPHVQSVQAAGRQVVYRLAVQHAEFAECFANGIIVKAMG